MTEVDNKEKGVDRGASVSTADVSPRTIEASPVSSRSFFGQVLDSLRKAFKNGEKELIQQKIEEIKEIEKLRTRDGVDFSRCQLGKLIEAYKKGMRMEVDCFSPYLADYNLSTGEIWDDKLTNADTIGLALAQMLRNKFPDSRVVSLYDEYNTGMTDSTNVLGAPEPSGIQIKLSDEIKSKFKEEVKRVLEKAEVIKRDDQEGKNYVIISESEKIKDAQELVAKLRATGNIQEEGRAIFFVNSEAENPEYQKILLRGADGHWTCEALDSSSFIKPENLHTVHLVILPMENLTDKQKNKKAVPHFKKQQDKVWEILRVLGIKPDNYHNIFYNENADPETVRRVIEEEIKKFE